MPNVIPHAYPGRVPGRQAVMQQPTRERGDSLEEFAIGDISVLGDDGFCVRLARSMFLEDSNMERSAGGGGATEGPPIK